MKKQDKSAAKLANAVSLHQIGALEDARKIYEEILKVDSRCFDAIQLMGVISLQKNSFAEALRQFDDALKINNQQASVWSNRGMALKGLGKFEEGLDSIDRAIELDPNFAESFYNKANILAKIGKSNEAIVALEKFNSLCPTNHLGFFIKGNLLNSTGKLLEAINAYERAISIKPDFIEAINNLGLCLVDLDNPDIGLNYFEKALKLQPKFFESLGNKGVALEKMGQYKEAIESYDAALAINPEFLQAYQNKGVALERLEEVEDAIKCYDKAISIDPNYAGAYFNRAYASERLLRFEQSLADYNKAIELEPTKVDFIWNRALLLLCSGDFERGWREYESRLDLKKAVFTYERNKLKKYEWLGSLQPLRDKTILLRAEQGLGDTIQFCRYVKILSEMGAKVILEVQPPLKSLLRNLDGLGQIISMGEITPLFDYYCNLMSLPYLLGTQIDSIPNKIPYLKADPQKTEVWKQKLGPRNGKRVGLVWSGGFRPDQPELWPLNRRRNIELSKLKNFKTEGIEFHSLQKGELPESELVMLHLQNWDGPKIINHADSLNDFTDTAALIENLDLVISVDTSTAHLAGALGKPVWLMNRFDTCWRWLLERQDSPWYPTFRIYRQLSPNDWESVVNRISMDLKNNKL
ncbi:tetratricopeptide repeat protein [Polynucleobacter sp. MWH-UH35A]|uniref:tetratricopeptide repeat protein n=1 Tax=Polynucleobacter sp. MWH-UH35A TaxID=1855619 RepID=UPI001BFE14F5|nr:tetratricopeptide repeat protein [Polynucleobacter sp. MWH-UH35A]QWD59755.1 tetratricopeptide repeat protein [Polynucleobacter sp. MWH-UH35A]